MSRRFFHILATGGLAVAMPLAVPAVADASPPRHVELLESLWTTVFQLPVDENPFTGGDPCLVLTEARHDRTVLAPFAPPTPETTCSASRGTKLFVSGWSSECSDVEGPPFFAEGEDALRECARDVDAGLDVPVVLFDGRRVRLFEVETGLMEGVLPADNIFDVDAGTPIQSVAHGWVALLPLTPGRHVLEIHVTGTYPVAPGPIVDVENTTIINVTR